MYRRAADHNALARIRPTTASPQGWRLLHWLCSVRRDYGLLKTALPLLLACLLSPGLGVQSAHGDETSTAPEEAFATVNGIPIQMSTYQTVLKLSARQHFYHGHPPEEELRAFRKQVGDSLIDESLMHQEAMRRGIEPDSARVNAELDMNVARLSVQPGWEQAREHLLPVLREGLERSDRIRQLEERFREEVTQPTEVELQSYYDLHIDKFTSPPQSRISMILLKVPAWGDSQTWAQRRDELEAIRHEISAGLEFSEAARRYSDDSSANSGGDMGYLHQGMLGTQAEAAIAALELNGISEPVTLLEGVALFRLMETTGHQVNPLEKVRQRALDLLMREKKAAAVDAAKQRLRHSAEIRYADPEYYELRQEVKGRSETDKS